MLQSSSVVSHSTWRYWVQKLTHTHTHEISAPLPQKTLGNAQMILNEPQKIFIGDRIGDLII